MKVSQYIISSDIIFFEENFKKRWNLEKYFDTTLPLIFFGFRGMESIFEQHIGYKIILPASIHDFPNFNRIKNIQNTIIIAENRIPSNYYIPDGVIILKTVLPIKDYSAFTSNKMGDKVYFYSGFKNGHQPNPIHFIEKIQSRIDYEIITTTHLNKNDYLNIEFLKSEFYDKCFVNLNFTNGHGMTTCRELALMGRKTITNNHYYDYSCMIWCKDMEHILHAIEVEAKKINTIQSSIDVHTYNYEILDVNLLLKNGGISYEYDRC